MAKNDRTRPIRTWDELPMILDTPTVSRVLGISENTVRKLYKDGTLPGQRIGEKCYKLRKEDLKAYVDSWGCAG